MRVHFMEHSLEDHATEHMTEDCAMEYMMEDCVMKNLMKDYAVEHPGDTHTMHDDSSIQYVDDFLSRLD